MPNEQQQNIQHQLRHVVMEIKPRPLVRTKKHTKTKVIKGRAIDGWGQRGKPGKSDTCAHASAVVHGAEVRIVIVPSLRETSLPSHLDHALPHSRLHTWICCCDCVTHMVFSHTRDSLTKIHPPSKGLKGCWRRIIFRLREPKKHGILLLYPTLPLCQADEPPTPSTLLSRVRSLQAPSLDAERQQTHQSSRLVATVRS